jgi:hypothetical protein
MHPATPAHSPALMSKLFCALASAPSHLDGRVAEFVIDAYHQLLRIERSLGMSKHELQARPAYHQVESQSRCT